MRSSYAVGAALALALAAGCATAPDRGQRAGDAAPASSAASAPAGTRATGEPGNTRPTGIPQGFLLHDKQAASEPGRWQADNEAFAPSYCPAGGNADVPRARAARTLQYRQEGAYDDGSGPGIDRESLQVYASEAEARRMMDVVRAEVRLCAGAKDDEGNALDVTQEPIDIGDEAISVRYHHGGDSSDVEIWVRRGTAVAAYGPSQVPVNGDMSPAERDARTMAKKLCRYDGGC